MNPSAALCEGQSGDQVYNHVTRSVLKFCREGSLPLAHARPTLPVPVGEPALDGGGVTELLELLGLFGESEAVELSPP